MKYTIAPVPTKTTAAAPPPMIAIRLFAWSVSGHSVAMSVFAAPQTRHSIEPRTGLYQPTVHGTHIPELC